MKNVAITVLVMALLIVVLLFAHHLDMDDYDQLLAEERGCAPGVLVPDLRGNHVCVTPRYSGATSITLNPQLQYSPEGAWKWKWGPTEVAK